MLFQRNCHDFDQVMGEHIVKVKSSNPGLIYTHIQLRVASAGASGVWKLFTFARLYADYIEIVPIKYAFKIVV